MKTKEQLESMTSKELAQYIIDITQTDICKNEKYCKMVCSIYRKKHIMIASRKLGMSVMDINLMSNTGKNISGSID